MRKKQKNNEENVKSGARIKALDVVIILLIITVTVGVYVRYNVLDMLTGNRNLKDYNLSFEINDIQYKTKNYINVGDKVYFYDSGEELGTLVGVTDDALNALSDTPAVKSFVPDGEISAVEVSYPEYTRIDAKGRMSCKGTYSAENGFLLYGTKHISPGDTISVRTNLVTVNIIVTEITAVE